MSRTTRHIPFFARYTEPFILTYAGLGITFDWCYNNDPRNALYHGYDGVSQSYYKASDRGYKENFQGDSRKFYKRYRAKQQRIKNKREILMQEQDLL